MYFSGLDFFAGTRCEGFGLPTRSRANSRTALEYEIQWLVRTKKKNLPPRADDRDRAKFAKAQSYMLRRDDVMVCKNIRCRKRFEITGVQSVAFLG